MEGEAGTSNLLKYVAGVLRGQLDDFLAGTAEAPGIRSTLGFAAQHILVSQDAMSRNLLDIGRDGLSSSEKGMNPDLWKSLPSQLLQLILPRLPLPQVTSLRLLSKDWKTSLDTPDSGLRGIFDEVSNTKFALVVPVSTLDRHDNFWVCAFDLRTNQWYQAKYTAPRDWHGVTICACEGGLLCFMFYFQDSYMEVHGYPREVRLVVWNPLTGDQDEIPNHVNCENGGVHFRTVQLRVDREAKHYKVVVVEMTSRSRDYADPEGYYQASVYDSGTKLWRNELELSSIAKSIFGYSYRCSRSSPMEQIPIGMWSYEVGDLLQRQTGLFRQVPPALIAANAISIAVTGGTVYMLYEVEVGVYGIGEGYYPEGEVPPEGRGITVRHHKCAPMNKLPQADYALKLHSCTGFLIVSTMKKNLPGPHQQRQLRHWLYDLSTEKWRELPALPAGEIFTPAQDVMCDLQRSVIPWTKPVPKKERIPWYETPRGRIWMDYGY